MFFFITYFRRELEELREQYNKERVARQFLEEDHEKLRKDKMLLDNELRQTIQRHEKEITTMNSLLNAVTFKIWH